MNSIHYAALNCIGGWPKPNRSLEDMMRVSLSGARSLMLVTALLMSSSAFAAPDATKIANSVVAAVQAKGGAKASFESAAANGDDVVITNLKVSHDGRDVTVPSVVITAPVERTPGGFTATSIAFDNGKAVEEEQTITWTTGVSQNAIVPDPSEVNSKAKLTPFSRFELTGLSISQASTPDPVTIADISVDLGNVIDGAPNDGKLNITGINVPGSVLAADEQTKTMFADLGYSSLLLNLAIDGGYDSSKSALTIRGITIDGKDMGKLAIGGTFGGLPREKLQNPDQMDELAPTATLENAQIRFEDAGLTNRILDMQAKQMGATRETLATMLPAALPLAFGQFNITDQAFQQKVVDAVGAFLKDPKSLTIKMMPAAPVQLMQIGQTAMTSPDSALSMLAIDVSANN